MEVEKRDVGLGVIPHEIIVAEFYALKSEFFDWFFPKLWLFKKKIQPDSNLSSVFDVQKLISFTRFVYKQWRK